MTWISRYCRLARLDSSGQLRYEEIEIAKTFFHMYCKEWVSQPENTDAPLQRRLVQEFRELGITTQEQRDGAELCLRCWISHQIEQTCVWLARKHGILHGFTAQELFPLVLDDEGALGDTGQTYRSLGQQILESYDRTQAGLSTWVMRQVRRHPEVSLFLRSQGVLLISDWAILNGTKPAQLERILVKLLTGEEIQQASALLQSYHKVYGIAYQQQRLAGVVKKGGTCPDPNQDQLVRMAAYLEEHAALSLSPAQVLHQLKILAMRLRQYRVAKQGGSYGQMRSLDAPELAGTAEKLQAPNHDLDSEEQISFLTTYRQEFEHCLDQALEQVTSDHVNYLQTRKPHNRYPFLKALHLFHCQGRVMSEIATHLGLQAQYQVTRLMKLKEFRADVRRKLLGLLCERVKELAKSYTDPDSLRDVDQQIDTILEEEVSNVFHEAETEAATAKTRTSLFSQRLCRHLDTRLDLERIAS